MVIHVGWVKKLVIGLSLFTLLFFSYINPNQPWKTTFYVYPFNVDIIYLEHVVVNMTLVVSGYGRGYDEHDFESEVSHVSDVDEVYQWLADPHPRRGDIRIELQSPHGTVSTLLPYRNYDFVNEEGYSNWPFMSVQHWGENPAGTWTLTVTFRSSSGYVRASGIRMAIHGTTTVPTSVQAIPAQCDSACARKCSGSGPWNCDACKDYRVASTLQCVSTCPNNTYVHNKYCLSKSLQLVVHIADILSVPICSRSSSARSQNYLSKYVHWPHVQWLWCVHRS